jgi:transcription elongation factor GreA
MAQELTQVAFDRLQEELEWRTGKNILDLALMIEKAREHGDLKENGEYHAAKDAQGLNSARVRELESLLKNATIVKSVTGDDVQIGTIVEIKIEGDDEPTTYLVGSIEEHHDKYDVLSVDSPMGQVILGTKPGDKVKFEGPRSTFNVEIISIRKS